LPVDILVVTYDADLYWLQIQARSINQYFNEGDINKIIIVHNNLNGIRTPIDYAYYGKFESKVTEVLVEDLNLKENKVDYLIHNYGWVRQQFCKLFVTSHCTAEWCYVLDSKTIFLNKYNQEKFFTVDGRSITFNQTNHPFFVQSNNWIEQFFGLEPSPHDTLLPKRGTPLMLHVPTVHNTIAETFWRTKTNFFNWFVEHQKKYNISEFDLYFSYIRYKNNLSEIYEIRALPEVKNLVLLSHADEYVKFDDHMQRIITKDNYFAISMSQAYLNDLPYHQQGQLHSLLHAKSII